MQEVTSKLTHLQTQLKSFVKKSPEQLEKFVSENSQHIHGDHFLMVEVKYMLCLMYGNVVGYQYKGLASRWHDEFKLMSAIFISTDLSEQQLQRKIEICGNILRVYDAIDPGEANQRNNVMFELKCATIVQTKIKLSRNLIERQQAIVWNISQVFLTDPKQLFELNFRL